MILLKKNGFRIRDKEKDKYMAEDKNLFILNHPVIQHSLSLLRSIDCPDEEFRRLIKRIATLMGYEVFKALDTAPITVQTPLESMQGLALKKPYPVIVPILRAGLGIAEGLSEALPEAATGHIGVYRDEETFQPHAYLCRLPDLKERKVFLVDPMLATGGSAVYALDTLVRKGARKEDITLVCLVAAPEGVKAIRQKYPNIPLYCAALDRCLNERAFICPGLGDAGDRLFGTGTAG